MIVDVEKGEEEEEEEEEGQVLTDGGSCIDDSHSVGRQILVDPFFRRIDLYYQLLSSPQLSDTRHTCR